MLDLPDDVVIGLCGFGAVVAGIRASMLIGEHKPEQVVLLGIAGSLSPALAVGDAYSFSNVDCYGIGAGIGNAHTSAEEMGWAFWDANTAGDQSSTSTTIRGSLPLNLIGEDKTDKEIAQRKLLMVCSAANSADDVETRLVKHPAAVAEDMESYSVAAACRLHDAPISVVRGISNRAGDRDKANWKIEEALRSVATIVNSQLKSS